MYLAVHMFSNKCLINLQGALETDIEKAREEGNWKKVIELATQLKDKGERGEHFLIDSYLYIRYFLLQT
jgi:hypothetical protein